MTGNEMGLRWTCDVCGNTYNTRKDAVRHVTHSTSQNDHKHLRYNPYDVVSLNVGKGDIETTNRQIKEILQLISEGKIKQCSVNIGVDEIEYVADVVDVYVGRVMRILEDIDMGYTWGKPGKQPVTYIEDTSGDTERILRYIQGHDNVSCEYVADNLGLKENTVRRIRNRYKWLIQYDSRTIQDSDGKQEFSTEGHRVGQEECRVIQRMYRNGKSFDGIREEIGSDRKNSTLREHGSGLCCHGDQIN